MVFGNIVVVFLIWLPQAVRQVLTWAYWSQVKEYRFDRIKVFLSTKTGRGQFGLIPILSKLLLILISVVLSSPTIAFLALALLDVIYLKEILSRQLRKPIFTQRAIFLLSTACLLVFLTVSLSLYYLQSTQTTLLLAELTLIFSFFVGVVWTGLVSFYLKGIEIRRAKETLLKIKPSVIGVTGSYGKTSTKEFIAHLLSSKFSVAKTEGSENTEFALAKRTQKIFKNTNFFVVEMGAYKKGEIAALAKIVNPDVGIVTGIEPQHISLFGSLQKIMDTKFELIEGLPEGGTAIFNLSDIYCKKLYERAKNLPKRLKVVGYGSQGAAAPDRFIWKVVSSWAKGIRFIIEDGESPQEIFAPVSGEHFVENLTVAILIARQFGISWQEIKTACRYLPQIEKRMEVSTIKKAIVIEDSFNTSPNSFAAAVKYLDFFKDRVRIVITPGIIELGRDSKKIHRDLGRLMSTRVNEIILLDEEPYEDILLGARKKRNPKVSIIKNSRQLKEKVEEILKENTALLLEGKMPSSISKIIEYNKNV